MATISLANAEIVRNVLQVAGFGRTAAGMDSAMEADVRAIIRSGLRRFYFPLVNDAPYQWRFLEKWHPIPAVPVFNDGTIEVAAGVVTLTGGVFPVDLTDYLLAVDGHTAFVTARTTDTSATISHTQLTVAAGTAFEARRFRYALPSDFGEWLGSVVYQDGSASRTLAKTSEAEMRLRYAAGQGHTETRHYDITSTPGAAGQKIVFWPVPAPTAFIQGVYLSVPDDNLPGSLTSPGSTVQVQPIYAEAVLEAILTAAEEYNDDRQGVHAARFQAALLAAIAHDRAVGGAYDFSRPIAGHKGIGQVLPIDFSSQII